jgi:hypothetical protein
MSEELKGEYEKTKFNVFEPLLTIEIGKHNADLDNLLLKNNKTEWAYITPCNPKSKVLTEKENNQRFNELKEKLFDYIFFEGEGVGTDPNWKPERSFLILGITQKQAIVIGNEYEQNAIVYGRKSQLPELLILRP